MCRCCIVRTCCCCKDLADGAFAWAIVEIIIHVMVVPLPMLLSEVAPAAAYFTPWSVVVVVANAVLMFGIKVHRRSRTLFTLSHAVA